MAATRADGPYNTISNEPKLLHNLVQGPEKKVDEFSEMRDKQSEQRRGRADGPIGSVADLSAVAENCALAPQAPKQRKGGRRWIENRRVLEGIL